MNNFDFYSPTKVVFGRDTVLRVAELIKEQKAEKILLHYGSTSVIKSGLLDKVKACLEKENIRYVELGGVVPNPRLSLVYEGIEIGKKENVDFILALGGGSVIDSAKAIAYGLKNDFDVWDLYDHKAVAKDCMGIGVILTIAAAGSETSAGSVITNEEAGLKRAYDDDLSRPKFAIMDPTLTMSLPDYQTACGCTDILMHTMERYFTNQGNMDVTDRIAESILKNVIKYAKILVNSPLDYEARAEIMWSGSIAHNDITGCGNGGGDWSTHMLEHEIGAMFDVYHGEGLAAVWGSWARYVYKDCLPRFKRFATNVMDVEEEGTDEEIALKGIEAMEEFYKYINMPISIRGLGINPTDSQLEELALMCSKSTGGSIGSAKKLYKEDMLNIYRMAM